MFRFKKKEKEKHKLTLHYVISNDGAGGASMTFYESEKLAKFMELCEDEGFGEDTYDSITVQSDSPIKHNVYSITNVEDCLEEWDDKLKYGMKSDRDHTRLVREYAILLNMRMDRDNA